MKAINQQQAENMVYEYLLSDGYTPDKIKEMPYKVTVSNGEIVCTALDGTWRDVYRVEYMPQLFPIGH